MTNKTISGVSSEEIKAYFQKHYSYVDFDITNEELCEYLSRPYIQGLPLLQVADLLYDQLIAGGSDVVE